MEFRTIVDIEDPGFRIGACEEMLFVGSCFADKIGARFTEEKFRTIVNPFGVMYNPASVLHTIQRLSAQPDLKSVKTAFLTLGTNHVYILNETGEIVDNCQKRPQSLFTEKELTVDECADYLQQAIDILHAANPDMRIVLTVSPIRYRKYGYHGSKLSKATLLLAVDKVIKMFHVSCLMFNVSYFPAYEIVNDELRDYRFYAEDMLHPSAQAVEYIWQRFSEVYLSDEAKAFIKEWQPLKAALNHKPFNPDSDEYRQFMDKTMLKIAALQKKYPTFAG
ncbi:GSCFA domain-containing protein [Prevotella sp. MA2016]|uniref:GSCFA domain-containing protein n=1 Tax=Prevotella sp. MA2016 TaxID=1408310 RepID=UPI00048CD2F3|nr:GSCFA domain-containing protein [Prevotella sp. MA2016]